MFNEFRTQNPYSENPKFIYNKKNVDQHSLNMSTYKIKRNKCFKKNNQTHKVKINVLLAFFIAGS